VLAEIKLSKHMDKPNIQVEEGMLIAEILPLIATYLLDTYSIGGTQRIFTTSQYVFSEEHAFFSSVAQFTYLVELCRGDDAAASALRYACQKTAVILRHVLPKGARAVALLADVRRGELTNSTVTVLDIATALAA
jgi:hypothetical protein